MKAEEIAWVVAGLFSLAALLISVHLIRQHHVHFTRPVAQSKIVGILWMVPIYAVSSWLGLRFKDAAPTLNMMRDCYEGYALYLFLALMVAYLGGGDERRVVALLETRKPMKTTFPMSLLFGKELPQGEQFLRWAKLGTLQYSVIKPSCAMMALVLSLMGRFKEGDFDPRKGWVWLTIIINASVAVAFYSLVAFYVMLKEPLAPFKPVPKFLCIKAVLFLSFWQGVVVAGLARLHLIHAIGGWSKENVETGIQDLLICTEMAIVATAHTIAFPVGPYVGGAARHSGHILEDHFAHHCAVRDFNEVMPVLLPSR
ncbi:organic solute transporter subunit alpha/Transmembrane protein [Tribonema minus]|uniref:Organic solute transporter subunit alpha/Transmembrane protein n=1 Tax=Tribonema minus TaxID=303371 RepID=A0A835Z2Y7_9STRA|nr:organic solute transporter subunit alpha/Transmembrane protein [Tribonema minus]